MRASTRATVQWYEQVHGDEERLVFQGEGCVDLVSSTKLRHVIVDARATLQRTVIAGWTAKRKPKRAVGAAESLRCFAAAGALALARASCQAAGRGVWLPLVACCGRGVLPHGVRHLMIFYTPGRDGTRHAARRPGSGGRPRGCGFEEQGGACARMQRGGQSPRAILSVERHHFKAEN